MLVSAELSLLLPSKACDIVRLNLPLQASLETGLVGTSDSGALAGGTNKQHVNTTTDLEIWFIGFRFGSASPHTTIFQPQESFHNNQQCWEWPPTGDTIETTQAILPVKKEFPLKRYRIIYIRQVFQPAIMGIPGKTVFILRQGLDITLSLDTNAHHEIHPQTQPSVMRQPAPAALLTNRRHILFILSDHFLADQMPVWTIRQVSPGGRLNKKDGLTRYGDSHVKDKTS